MLTEEKIQFFLTSLMRLTKHDSIAKHVEIFKTRYLKYLSALANNQPFDSFSILKDHLNVLEKQEYFFADYLSEIVRDIGSGGNDHKTILTEDPEILERIKTIVCQVAVACIQFPQHIQNGRSAFENRLIKSGPTKEVFQQVVPKVNAKPPTCLLSRQINSLNTFKKSTSAVREALSEAPGDLIKKKAKKTYPVLGLLFNQKTPLSHQCISKKPVSRPSLLKSCGSQYRSLHHANVSLYRRKCMQETLQAFEGRTLLPLITENFIRQNWRSCSTEEHWDGFNKEALIYLVTGQPAGHLFDDLYHGVLKPLPTVLQQDPVDALDNMSNLDDNGLTVLCRLFGKGMLGHHLRSWMHDNYLQFMMLGYHSAILALVEKQNIPIEEALRRTKGITENEAWVISRSLNNEKQVERAFNL